MLRIDPQSLKDSFRAIRLYEKATGKTAAETLNRFMRNVLIRLMRLVKAATLGNIRRAADPDRKTNSPIARLPWKKAAQAGHRKGEGIGDRARKWFNRRVKSRGYVKAGFIPALRKFGGRTGNARLVPGGDASRGKGRKARDGSLLAAFENFSDGADIVAGPKASQAFSQAADDMETYAQRKMQKDADRYSARR